jgi:A/G-specific adenine glycosylase
MSRNGAGLKSANLNNLRHALLHWYDENSRELPWRRDADPYRVWVSEIMLQQTRVAAVLDHYAQFMQRFPTVQALAAARESSVLAAWSGLGYYHRARRTHQAAKVIGREHEGRFPRTAAEWRKLPGIGRYTAAAIASIAFGEAVAVVDGNVERVLARMVGGGDGKEALWQQAECLLDRERPGDFNQALMELGATVCTPRAPQCLVCPLHAWCMSRGAEAVRPRASRKRKQLCYALARRGGAVLLVQRSAKASLMAGMWELPAILVSRSHGSVPLARFRHSITDTDYEVSVIAISPDTLQTVEANGGWFVRKQWERLPLTGLARKALRRLLAESGGKTAESNRRS